METLESPSTPTIPSTFLPLAVEVAALERQRIEQALRASDGVQQRAAELLHIPVRTLFNKIRRYDLLSLTQRRGRTIAQESAPPAPQAQPLRDSSRECSP